MMKMKNNNFLTHLNSRLTLFSAISITLFFFSILFIGKIFDVKIFFKIAHGNSASLPSDKTALDSSIQAQNLTTPSKNRKDKIILGTSAAFQGSSRALGIELYRGAMAYFEDINSKGGIHGKQVEIKLYDDGYNPIPTIRNTQKLIERDNVLLLFNYVGTPTVTSMLPLLNHYDKRNIFLFFPFTGAQPQRQFPYDSRVFNLRASYRQETEDLVEKFVQIGRKRIAIFYQIDAYGRSGWDGVKQGLNKHNLDIAAEATYQRGATYDSSFKAQVETLQAAQPDAVIVVGSYAASAGFIRDMRDSDWNIPIAIISFVGSENLLNLLQQTSKETGEDYTPHLISSQVVPYYDDMNLPAVQEYHQLMEQYDPKLPSEFLISDYQYLPHSFVSFEGFLNAKLLTEIIQRAADQSADYNQLDIAAAAESIKEYDLGIGNPISFGPERHQALDQIYYMTVKGNQFVPLENWSRWEK